MTLTPFPANPVPNAGVCYKFGKPPILPILNWRKNVSHAKRLDPQEAGTSRQNRVGQIRQTAYPANP